MMAPAMTVGMAREVARRIFAGAPVFNCPLSHFHLMEYLSAHDACESTNDMELGTIVIAKWIANENNCRGSVTRLVMQSLVPFNQIWLTNARNSFDRKRRLTPSDLFPATHVRLFYYWWDVGFYSSLADVLKSAAGDRVRHLELEGLDGLEKTEDFVSSYSAANLSSAMHAVSLALLGSKNLMTLAWDANLNSKKTLLLQDIQSIVQNIAALPHLSHLKLARFSLHQYSSDGVRWPFGKLNNNLADFDAAVVGLIQSMEIGGNNVFWILLKEIFSRSSIRSLDLSGNQLDNCDLVRLALVCVIHRNDSTKHLNSLALRGNSITIQGFREWISIMNRFKLQTFLEALSLDLRENPSFSHAHLHRYRLIGGNSNADVFPVSYTHSLTGFLHFFESWTLGDITGRY